MFRPFGVNKDSSNYEIHANQTCNILECGLSQNVNYDIGYFFFLSIAKVFFEGTQAILFLGGLALALKLILIARITSYSILSLYLYFSLFFLPVDFSSLRFSLALSFSLLALFLISKDKKKAGALAYGVSLLTHYQALIAPIAQLVHVIIGRRYLLAISLIVISQLAIAVGFVPTSYIIDLFQHVDSRRILENLFIDSSRFRLSGTLTLTIMLLGAISFPLNRMAGKDKILAYSFSYVVTGFLIYWLTAGMSVIPDRILQFFLVPLTILVSLGRYHIPTYLITITVGIIFFGLYTWYDPIIFP
jgi:hypothetical protein